MIVHILNLVAFGLSCFALGLNIAVFWRARELKEEMESD